MPLLFEFRTSEYTFRKTVNSERPGRAHVNQTAGPRAGLRAGRSTTEFVRTRAERLAERGRAHSRSGFTTGDLDFVGRTVEIAATTAPPRDPDAGHPGAAALGRSAINPTAHGAPCDPEREDQDD